MVNGERQIQALVDKKKILIMETSIRSDLHLEDTRGTDCLPTATIFEELARMGSTMASLIICLATNQKFNLSKYIFDAMVKHLDGGVKFRMYPRYLQVFINQQVGDMSHHKKIYVNPSHTKKIFTSMRREGKNFFGRVTPLFETMMVKANQEEGVDSGIPPYSQQTPINTQPSSSRSQKKHSRRKQRKDTAVTQEETQQDDSVPTPSIDPPLSGEDSMQLSELMLLCTNLQKQVLNLEKAKDAQAKEIAGLKKRVQKLERKKEIKNYRIQKIKESWSDDAEMFNTNDLHGDEVDVYMPVGEKQEQSAKEREADTSVEDSSAPTTIEEITLAQTLIQIKVAKPKVFTIAATKT
ncbi:hypothetical protein Tco_1454925, partial [Tanacetum coccineum]